ncbi:MAG TPA: hypothetical protein VFZ69_05020 [Longimicrobiales bacterium]
MPTAYRALTVLAVALLACTDPQGPSGSEHTDSIPRNLPDALPAARIEAGDRTTCATTAQGELSCWGVGSAVPRRIAEGRRFQDLFGETCGLTIDYVALCWDAWNDFTEPRRFWEDWPFQVLRRNRDAYCGLLTSGRAYCWGNNYNGRLGTGDEVSHHIPAAVAGSHRFTALAMGGEHACAIDDAGALWCWGVLHLAGSEIKVEKVPVLIPTDPPLVQVAAGSRHTCGLAADGRAYCWGAGERAQIGDGGGSARSQPTPVATDLRFTTIAAAYDYACALTAAGAAHCWGSRPLTGAGSLVSVRDSVPQPVPPVVALESITVGMSHACGFGADGEAYCWGYRGTGQLGSGSTVVGGPAPPAAAAVIDAERVLVRGDAAFGFSCAVDVSGAAWCWGANAVGQLGDGTTEDRTVPVRIAGNMQFDDLSLGGDAYGYACGLATDGTAWCWGSNLRGQLGTGDRVSRATPTAVAGGLRYESISAGYGATCAIAVGGRPHCWGNDDSLQPAPAPVPDSVRFIAIATGTDHACALAADSLTWCWGRNTNGQLGRGSVSFPPEPGLPIAGDYRFGMIAVGTYVACGLTADGTAYCWGVIGGTRYGFTIASAPTPMTWPPLASLHLDNVFAVCGIRLDGTSYCDAPESHQNVRFTQIQRAGHTCGITDSGSLLCWGRRDRGQLGDGVHGWVAEPQRVNGFSRGG